MSFNNTISDVLNYLSGLDHHTQTYAEFGLDRDTIKKLINIAESNKYGYNINRKVINVPRIFFASLIAVVPGPTRLSLAAYKAGKNSMNKRLYKAASKDIKLLDELKDVIFLQSRGKKEFTLDHEHEKIKIIKKSLPKLGEIETPV